MLSEAVFTQVKFKVMRKIRKIEVKIRQIIWAFENSFKPTTYDIVIYKDKEYFIRPTLTAENVWNLFEKDSKEPSYVFINGKNFYLVQSIKRVLNVFKKHLMFQKNSWGSIDCVNPIGTRLSYKNSKDIYFKEQNC